MEKCAFLEYIFIFDPSETFAHLYEFENVLSQSFKEAGMELEIVSSVDSNSGKRIVMIKRIEPASQPAEEPQTVPVKSIKQIKAQLTRKQGFDGKFVKYG